MSECRKCGYEADYGSGRLRLVNMISVATQGGSPMFECRDVRDCAHRAELRDVRAELAAARTWLDSGPDDPAAIESVAERLLTCGTGPSPEGWSEGAIAVSRRDVAEIVRALRGMTVGRDAMEMHRDAARDALSDLRAAADAVVCGVGCVAPNDSVPHCGKCAVCLLARELRTAVEAR